MNGILLMVLLFASATLAVMIRYTLRLVQEGKVKK